MENDTRITEALARLASQERRNRETFNILFAILVCSLIFGFVLVVGRRPVITETWGIKSVDHVWQRDCVAH